MKKSAICHWLYLGVFSVATTFTVLSDDHDKKSGRLETIRNQFEDLRAKLLIPQQRLDKQFGEQLKALRAAAVKSGDLDLIIAIDEEKKTFLTKRHSEFSIKPDLARLQRIYREETRRLSIDRERRLAELVSAYMVKLNDLEKEVTKLDEITDALEVRSEMQRIQKLADVLESTIAEILTSRSWVRHDVKINKRRNFVFSENGRIQVEGGVSSSWISWEVIGNYIVMSQKNGTKYEFTLQKEDVPLAIEGRTTGRSEFYFVETAK